MERCRDEGEQRRIEKIGAPPTGRFQQQMGRRPAHGRGKAADQRECGDRAARGEAKNASERREGGIIEGARDRHAEQHPDREIGNRMRGIDERDQAERAQQGTNRHHTVATVSVDQPSGARRNEPRREQREREAAHRKGDRKVAVGRDQRHRQHRRIEDRAPGENLSDAENQHGASGAEEDIAQIGHDGECETTGDDPSTASLRPGREGKLGFAEFDAQRCRDNFISPKHALA